MVMGSAFHRMKLLGKVFYHILYLQKDSSYVLNQHMVYTSSKYIQKINEYELFTFYLSSCLGRRRSIKFQNDLHYVFPVTYIPTVA